MATVKVTIHAVIVNGLEGAIKVKNMILEKFMASKIYLYIDESVVNSQITHISIINCAFIESALALMNVYLTIKDSTFSDSTSTAIMLFSSTLTVVGNVIFHNNKGYQGGALMLVGTVMNIARDAKLNLLFLEDTGGAIFVVYPQTMINAHSYVSSYFYQSLDFEYYPDIYSINFINNTATKGGDHIYGVSLISTCALTRDIAYDNIDPVHSIEIFGDYFWFDPCRYKSAVSADATRVCVCDDNGELQYDTVVKDIHAYPGTQFFLHLVVVGGDFGTTTGNVHTSFLYPTLSSSLGSPNQRHQIITTASECSMLNFSVYSNESKEILYLTTKEVQPVDIKAYYIQSMLCLYIYCDIDNEQVMSPLFIDIDLLPCPLGFILSGDPPSCRCHPLLIANGVSCILNHSIGYHSWSLTHMWIKAVDNNDSNDLLFSTHCPFSYCEPDGKRITSLLQILNTNCFCNYKRS